MTAPSTTATKPNVAQAEDISGYTIRVIEDIHDPALVHHWKRIEEDADVFPQMYYEWCEPWWRLRSGKRKLHVVAVEDSQGKIVGIAPLCIEKRFGLRVLRSFPIHFGDFYAFLVAPDADERAVHKALLQYLTTYRTWRLVHLYNINSRSKCYEALVKAGFPAKHLSEILVADFSGICFGEYMAGLSKNTRLQFGKKLRRLEKLGQVTLEVIEDAAGYAEHAEAMRYLYCARWADDHRLPPDEQQNACRDEAVQSLFAKGKMALFLLRLDGQIKIFRLGFLHRKTYFGWKVGHDPEVNKYSPGSLILGKIIEELTHRNYSSVNFMTGAYGYKRSWATEGAESTNYELFTCGTSLQARAYLKYRLHWRDNLRARYHALLKFGWIRAAKRWIETQRRRVSR